MVKSFEELGEGRVRVLFSDGKEEVYFFEDIEVKAFFERFSCVATHYSLQKFQNIIDFEENTGCQLEVCELVKDFPEMVTSEGFIQCLDDIIAMNSL